MSRMVKVVGEDGSTLARFHNDGGTVKGLDRDSQTWLGATTVMDPTKPDEAEEITPQDGDKYLDGLFDVYNGAGGGPHCEEVQI